MSRKTAVSVNDAGGLADELFALVETDQGNFYVSDGDYPPDRKAFFAIVRGQLEHGRIAVRQMRTFLKKYGEL